MEATYFQQDDRFLKLNLQDCVMQYRQSGNDFLFRAILYKLKGTFNYFMYYKTNYPDKAELMALFEDKLIECLSTYNEEGSASFLTYYNTCLNNALINFTKRNKTNTLSLDFEYENDHSDSMYTQEENTIKNKLMDESNSMVDSESTLLIEALKDKLDDNEYRVCKVILSENHQLTHTEIAKEIGLTVPAIKGIFNRLQKRFITNDIYKNNLYSL